MSTTNPKMSVKRLQVYSWAVLFTFADERYICTESENRRRSQGVAYRCHRVIFFKWGTFGVI
jgi:hypothetical protein